MQPEQGWVVNPVTLMDEVVDRAVLDRQLASAAPVDRLVLLRVLGRLEEALSEAHDYAPSCPAHEEWRLLLATADVRLSRHEFRSAQILQDQAWLRAQDDATRAEILYSVGRRWFGYGDLFTAASFFECARSLAVRAGGPMTHRRAVQALDRVRMLAGVDVIVLAGGAGSRLRRTDPDGSTNADKPGRTVGDWPLLEHILVAASAASRRIVVGPERGTSFGEPEFCREDPPLSGPVAALRAGLERVQQPTVFFLGTDVPFIGAGLELLRSSLAGSGAEAAALVDTSGRTNYLASLWRTEALAARLSGLEAAHAPLKLLYTDAAVIRIPDFDAVSSDCDTVEELGAAEERFRHLSPEQRAATPLAWLARP